MRNAKLRGCRKPATYAKTLSITKISTLHLELRGDPTRSVPGSAGLATVTTCFPFGYGVNLASVTSPHNLGFHPYSKEVRSLGHLEVFTNCAPGRKGKKEENIASEQRCDIMIPQRHQHHNPSTLMPHRQGAELGGGKPVAPSGRKGRRTASSPDTPPPPHPRFLVTQGSRGLTQAGRSREPSSEDPRLCLPWSSQPPPQTPGSGAETVKRTKTLFEPLWAQAGAADVELAGLRLAQTEAASPPELWG